LGSRKTTGCCSASRTGATTSPALVAERGLTTSPPALDAKKEAMTTQEQEQTRAAWDTIAPGYDEFVTPTHMWVANEGLRRAELRPGMRFLDVAAGSGALSIPAARLGAQVLSVDLSPTMVGRLEARARNEGLSNLEARVMDGHALELEDNTFDVAGSQFGVMLFPDLPRGLREMARVTKPGGRVLLNVLGPPAKIEFLGFFVAALQAAVPGFTGLPSDPPPLPFQVADPEKLRQELAKAGLRAVRVETITEKLAFRSGRQMWDWVVNSNPIGAHLVADLTDEQRAVVQKGLEGMIRERAGGSGPATLTNPVHIGVGTK
jgi:ubiquinone/menaquinone biosynthesis C-methylase UbiE